MCIDDVMLNAYMDGMLEEPWRSQVEEHLSYCTACQKRLEELGRITEGIKSASLDDDETAFRAKRVMNYFEENKFGSQKKGWLHRTVHLKLIPAVLTSAAAFVVVFIGAFVLVGINRQQTEDILPGIVLPMDTNNVTQVKYENTSLDDFTLDEIVQYLDSKGYAVKLEVKTIGEVE